MNKLETKLNIGQKTAGDKLEIEINDESLMLLRFE